MNPLTANLPRIPLAQLPTPIAELKNLRRKLGNCPRLLIKRDDLTGLATGGNKTRKLEFLIADALQQGAATVITVGGAQSNHCRQTVAAAAKHGLRCVLVLSGAPIPAGQWNGNLLLDDLLGAEIVWAQGQPRDAVVAQIVEKLQAKGASPYVIPIGGSNPVGITGYVAAVEELASQLIVQKEKIDRIVVVSGSGGTHAGVLVGVKSLRLNARVEGMNNFAIPDIRARVRDLCRETIEYLHLDILLGDEDFIFHAACGQHEYGVLTNAEREAIRLLARTEGILLDPVYTARAFGQMLAFIRAGVYAPGETILFWHTGGTAALFAYAAELMNQTNIG